VKQPLSLGLTAVALFALSATISYFVFRDKLSSSTGSSDGHAEATPADAEKVGKRPPGSGASAHPPGGRPGASAGTEEAAKLAATLRERLAAVGEREAQAAARQKNLELVAADIRNERVAIEQVHKQVLEDLKRLDDKLEQLEQKDVEPGEDYQQKTERLPRMKKAPEVPEKVELGKQNDLGSMFRNLTPEAAAKVVEQLAVTDKLDQAAELLADVPGRDAAKILSVLPDPNLACRLAEMVKERRRTHPPGKE